MNGNGRAWLVVESLLATGLTLYLALRLEISSIWFVLPILLLILERRSLDDYGLELRITPPSVSAHLAIGLAGLAIYAAGHILVAQLWAGQVFSPRLPDDFGGLVFWQLLGVAIPEEIFFRGYLQTNLDRAFGRSHRIFGALLGPGLFAQAALFAICHLVTGDWMRLRVFFFALLAGWLRQRSGSIAAPALYHAIANAWVAILESSFR